MCNFTSGGVQNRETKNRRLGMIVMSFQDFKPRGKLIPQSFSYCEQRIAKKWYKSALFMRKNENGLQDCLVNNVLKMYVPD